MILAVLAIVVGLTGLLVLAVLAARARRTGRHAGNRPTWDSRPAGLSRDEVTLIADQQRATAAALEDAADTAVLVVDWQTPAVPTMAERAARAAAMRRHPSLYRPTRVVYSDLAASVDEALATVDECSDACTRNVCEWCPEADRQAARVAEFAAELEQLPAVDEPVTAPIPLGERTDTQLLPRVVIPNSAPAEDGRP